MPVEEPVDAAAASLPPILRRPNPSDAASSSPAPPRSASTAAFSARACGADEVREELVARVHLGGGCCSGVAAVEADLGGMELVILSN
ncbi:hypothetical protein E2562_008885 [Oryza meyeriana var. granulata]|uniref:Uncharacterized protein n=1 Tax=Oryza meyeriana var. granulata TaxID=110450 RepID=A0A6G1D0F9_9ORYZ|nr:hypothetical protein E2562_008885 [Oryza meyeriana var. granulata]